MAQDKILQTRISLKYDTYANWHSKNPALLEGEVAVVVVPTSDPVGTITNVPTVLFKVGDGTKKFDDLPWVSGPAGDVHAWAKEANKPSYTATEIAGLDTYISGQIQDTDTQYKIAISGRTVQLFKKDKDGPFGTTPDSTFNLPDEKVHTLVEGTTNGTVKYDGTDVKVHGLGSAAYEDKTFLDTKIAEAKKAGTDAQTAVNTLSGKVGTVPENKTVIGLIAEAKKAGTDAQTSVGALDTRVGAIPAGSAATTVVGYVDEKIGAIPAQTDYSVSVSNPTSTTYAQVYEFKQLGKTIGTINIPKDMVVQSGSVETKAEEGAWGEAGTYLHLVLANADNSSIYINVGDLIEYVSAGSGENDAIQIDISADHKVSASVKNGSITLAMLATAVQTEIGKAHTHTNKTVLDSISADKVSAWDSAEQNAKDYTDTELNGALTLLASQAVVSADGDDGSFYALSNITQAAGKIKKEGEVKFAKIAKTANVADLVQTEGNYVVFNCGSATVNI